MATLQSRCFAQGERVRVAKKSRVIDKERRQEGPGSKPPIDVDVTGCEGEVCAEPYESPTRGEFMIPIRLPNEAVISVPEDRVERSGPPPSPKEQRAHERVSSGDGPGPSPVGKETIEFWRNYFAMEEKAKQERQGATKEE